MKYSRFSHFLAALTLISLFVGMVFNFIDTKASFGISPPWVKNDHLLPGTTFEQVINLSRSDTEEAMKATVRISGDKEVMKWISIQDEENLVMKKGQDILPMKVTVDVPKRAALKNYAGSIFVSLAPLASDASLGGGQVSITLGANIKVDLTVVGKKIYDYRVNSISVDPLQEGDPFSLNVKVENLGNVEVSNANGQIEIYNDTETEIVESLDFLPLSEAISPDETKVSKMIFANVILDPGKYWVFVQTFNDGKIVYENRLLQEVKAKVVPVVTPEAALAQKPSLPKTSEVTDATLPPPIEVPVSDLRPVAPAATETSNPYLIFGLAGFGFGLITLVGVIVGLIIILKKQQAIIRKDNNFD